MKQTVKLSTFSITLSALSLIVLLVSAYYCRDNWGLYLIGALIIALMMLTLFYMPMSTTCSADELLIQRSLRIKSIPLSDIQSVKLCPPTMAEHRLCGSGGWFGYWGWFSEPSIGKYFAYYGKACDCFLVTLKNGKRYKLGCQNPSDMVDYINSQIRN